MVPEKVDTAKINAFSLDIFKVKRNNFLRKLNVPAAFKFTL